MQPLISLVSHLLLLENVFQDVRNVTRPVNFGHEISRESGSNNSVIALAPYLQSRDAEVESDSNSSSETIVSEEDTLQSLVVWLLDRLKTLMETPYMQVNGFEQKVDAFREDIELFTRIVINSGSPRKLLYQQKYLQHLFEVMVETSKLLEYFSLTESEQHLVTRLVFLNSKLMALHDEYGIPKIAEKGFRDNVTHITESFQSWSSTLRESASLPATIREILETQSKELQYFIGILASRTDNENVKKMYRSPEITLEISYE